MTITLFRHCLKSTLQNGVWALLDFGELAPRTVNGLYANGYYTETPANSYQRARGISRVFSYHGPGLLWNHNDTLDLGAAPKPVTQQPAASVTQHGHYYTWPTKVTLLPNNHAGEQGHVTAEAFLQAFEAHVNQNAAGPHAAAAVAAAPLAPLPVFQPAVLPAPVPAVPLATITLVVPTQAPALAAGNVATSSDSAFVTASSFEALPTVALATPKKSTKAGNSKRLVQVPVAVTDMEELEAPSPQSSNFVASFNPPPNDDNSRSESPVESEPPIIRRRTKKPRKFELEDDEPLASTPAEVIFHDSERTPATAKEVSPSTTFTSPSILRKKKAPVNKKTRTTPINKKLSFEAPPATPAFDVRTLFETEAVEASEDEQEEEPENPEEESESEDLKTARRLLKQAQALRRRAVAPKPKLTRLRKTVPAVKAKPKATARAVSAKTRAAVAEVIEIVDSSDAFEELEDAEDGEVEF